MCPPVVVHVTYAMDWPSGDHVGMNSPSEVPEVLEMGTPGVSKRGEPPGKSMM